MTLREKLLGIPGIGEQKADAVLEVLAAEPAQEGSGDLSQDLIQAIRDAKNGANHPHGCPFCGISGCNDRCPAWGV